MNSYNVYNGIRKYTDFLEGEILWNTYVNKFYVTPSDEYNRVSNRELFFTDTPHFEFRFRKACHVVKIVTPSPQTISNERATVNPWKRREKWIRESVWDETRGGLWSASNRVGKQFRRVLPRLQPSDYQWTPTCAGSITHVLHSSSLPLFLSLFSSRACLVPCARLIYEAFSRRRRRGNRVAITDDRTKRDEETGGKASSAAPTRGNSREPCGEIGRWLVKAIARSGKRWTEEE